MSSLSSVLNRLPAVIRTRYGGANYTFWVDICNSLLEEIEESCLGPTFRKVTAYPRSYLNGVAYMPEMIRNLRSIRDSDGNGITFSPVGFDGFAVDSEEADTETPSDIWTTSTTTEPLRKRQDGRVYRAVASTYAGDPAELIGKAVVVYSTTSERVDEVYDGWVIEDAFNSGGYLYVNLPPEVEFPRGINYGLVIHNTFVYLDGYKKLYRVELVSDDLPLPPNYDKFLVAGLRYYGEIQTDETSPNARYWAQEWARMKRQLVALSAKKRGTIFNARPSQVMSLPGA